MGVSCLALYKLRGLIGIVGESRQSWERSRYHKRSAECLRDRAGRAERGREKMPAKRPEEICHLFQHAMAEGDIDSVLSVYDPEAVFVNQSRDVTKGREGLRQELAPLAARRARFDFTIKQVIEAGDIALMHTE